VVRNGHARERKLTVGSSTVAVRAPRVNDKRVDEQTGERKRFSSRILAKYARRSPKVTEALAILYLHGLSTGDFAPALRDLLGGDASGLSPSSIQRLTESWQAEHEAFRRRELRFHRYAYWFVDGVHVTPMPLAERPPRSPSAPLLDDPCGHPLLGQPQDPPVRDPVLKELLQPSMVKGGEELTEIHVEHPIHLLAHDPDRQRIQRVMRGAPRPNPYENPRKSDS
jgi:hypothetical protein